MLEQSDSNAGDETQVHFTVADIVNAVCIVSRISRQDIYSDRRERLISNPRQITMLVAYNVTGKTRSNIARHLKRDHKTVFYGVERAREKVRDMPSMAALYRGVMDQLQNKGRA